MKLYGNYTNKQTPIARYLITAILLTLLSGGCDQNKVKGNGREKFSTRALQAFQTATIYDNLDVTLQHGSPSKVEITADANLHRHISIQVENGRLQIKTLKVLQSRNPIGVRLVSPDVSEATYIGSKMLSLKLDAEETFILNHKNNGSITGMGAAQAMTVNIEGEGEVNLRNISTEDVSVTSTSSANIAIKASRSAQINHYGSGVITLWGSPQNVTENIKGSGQLLIQ